MKYVKKVFGVLASFMLIAGVFTSCSDSDNSSPNEPSNDRTYLADGGEVTVTAGESTTVYVKGKTTVDAFTCDGLTVEALGDEAFKITAAEDASDAQVSLNFNDGSENDEGVNVTLYLYSPYYVLNISLDESLAGSANSIEVYAEGKEDSESTASLKQTVTASYTAGESTATAKLAKDKANAYKFFNNIVVTVKNSSNENIDVEVTPAYFCYTDESFTGINVSAATTEKTFTITFEGFDIPGGSVTGLRYCTKWYSSTSEWTENDTVTPTVTVSEDGTSATFAISSVSEFYVDWTGVVVKDSDSNEIELSAGNTESNKWYSYADTASLSNTFSHVAGTYTALITDQSFTGSSSYVQIAEASSFTDLSVSALKVVVKITSADESWASASSATSYVSSTYQSLTWSDTESGYAATITSSDFISALKTNGLYLECHSSATGSVSVSYIQ